MRSRILILAQDVAARARLARALGAAGHAVELAESAGHARRLDRTELALAVVVPTGLEPDANDLITEWPAGTNGVLLVRDAADEASLPSRVAEALKRPPALEEASPVLHFAGYRLDVAGHSLTGRTGAEIPLSAGEFALLQALAQRAGRVLSRERLLQMLAGRDADQFDRSIDMQISRLRRKIEPDPKQPSLIVTVAGSGYKFAAEVTRTAGIPATQAGAPAPVDPAPAGRDDVETGRPSPDGVPAPQAVRSSRQPRIRLYGAIGAVALAVCVLAVWLLGPAGPAPATRIPAIAVLPFDNLSANPADVRLADGITEDIITDLSRDRGFTVIARDSTDVYKGKPADVRQIGKDLNVTHVLEGSFQRDGGQVRISAQLIDAATGIHIWSERYDRPADQVFAVQSDVAEHILNSLSFPSGNIPKTVLMAAKRKRPADLGAYELMLLGREKMEVGQTAEAQLEAKRLLEQAIALDPHFARAYASLALNYAWRITVEPDTETLVRGMLDAAQHANNLDPLDSYAHLALGWSLGMLDDKARSEAEFNETLRLAPNLFINLIAYGCFAYWFDKAREGAAGIDRAIRINPSFPTWAIPCARLGLFMDGRYEDALKVQQRQPEAMWNTDGFAVTASSLVALGRTEEAKALAKRGAERFPGMLTVEKFALNRQWDTGASRVFEQFMRKAGFPVCATGMDLATTANPVRLPECLAQ